MFDVHRYLTGLRRRLFVGEFLHLAAGWLAGFLVLMGVAVLSVKLFAPQLWPHVLWFSLLTVPLLGTLAWRAVRRMPADRDVIALLDQRLGVGGLLMTLIERPDGSWQQRLPAAEMWRSALPQVWPVRFAKGIALPALFAVGAGFVPVRDLPPPAPVATAGTDAAQELVEAFELLEQTDAINEETRSSLKQELEQLADEAESQPLTHEKWETVDALRERLRAGLDTTELSVSKGESAVAALAAALAGGEALSVERTERLSKELSEALETLRKNGAFNGQAGQPSADLSSELQKLLKNGDFQLPSDPAAKKAALDELRQLLESEQKRLAEAREKCQSCLGGQCLSNGQGLGQIPGSGGINRGRGDAELSFGQESNEQAAKFKETVLPPGYLDRPSDNVLGVTASAPKVDPAAGVEARNAVRNAGPATGKATWDRPLRPRHREVVRSYFGDE